MDFPPPPEMFPKNFKNGGFNLPSARPNRKAQGKKIKPPLDSYEWFFFVGINAEGDVDIRSSSNVRRWKHKVLTTPANELRELYQGDKFGDDAVFNDQQRHSQLDEDYRIASDWPGQPRVPCERLIPEGSISYPFQTHSKRRRVDSRSPEPQTITNTASSNETTKNINPTRSGVLTHLAKNVTGPQASQRLLNIKYCDREEWIKWFTTAFLAIQQQSCRTIAKEWIKLIHPKKQSTHPYNGNMPRHLKASPNRTKPPYWPEDVQHREPDHIDKHSRTNLLVHLLINTPHGDYGSSNPDEKNQKETYARDLLNILVKKKDELKDKWQIIQEVIDCRTGLEQYEQGGADGDTVTTVLSYEDGYRHSASSKNRRGRTKVRARTDVEDVKNEEVLVASPVAVASPTGTIQTLGDSENEDNLSPVNVSFTSTVTQSTSHSSAPTLQAEIKSESTSENNDQHHLSTQGMDQHSTMLIDSVPTHINMDYTHHEYIPTNQPTTHHAWPATNASVPGVEHAFADGMMQHVTSSMLPVQHYDSGTFSPSHSFSTNHALHMGPCHLAQSFGYDYSPDGMAEMPYRGIPGMSQDVITNPHLRLFMPAQQSFSNQHPPGQ